jgi:hypothetical protein
MLIRALRFERVYGDVVEMPPFRRKKRDIHTHIRTYIRTNITRKALKFGAIMEKTPNSNAPTLKLVNGPAGRDYYLACAAAQVILLSKSSTVPFPAYKDASHISPYSLSALFSAVAFASHHHSHVSQSYE